MQHPQKKHPNCTAKTAGRACAAGLRATGATRLACVSTGDSRVFAFHPDSPDTYGLVQELATRLGSKTMGYDHQTRNTSSCPAAITVPWKCWPFPLSPDSPLSARIALPLCIR